MNSGFEKVFERSGIRLTLAAPRGWRILLVLLCGLAAGHPMAADTVFKADFTFSPSSPAPGQPVSFTDATKGLPSSWSWDFGDGSNLSCNDASCRNPTHTYAAPGTYTVTLRVVLKVAQYGQSDQATKSVP